MVHYGICWTGLLFEYVYANIFDNQLPFFSNISQILLLYKTWGYYNKFDSIKSLGIYKVDVTDVLKYYNAGKWSMD